MIDYIIVINQLKKIVILGKLLVTLINLQIQIYKEFMSDTLLLLFSREYKIYKKSFKITYECFIKRTYFYWNLPKNCHSMSMSPQFCYWLLGRHDSSKFKCRPMRGRRLAVDKLVWVNQLCICFRRICICSHV